MISPVKIQIDLDLAQHILFCLQNLPHMDYTCKQFGAVITYEVNRLAFIQSQHDEEIPF